MIYKMALEYVLKKHKDYVEKKPGGVKLDLTTCDLRGMSFFHSDLSGSDFTKARMDRCDFSHASMNSCNFEGVTHDRKTTTPNDRHS